MNKSKFLKSIVVMSVAAIMLFMVACTPEEDSNTPPVSPSSDIVLPSDDVDDQPELSPSDSVDGDTSTDPEGTPIDDVDTSPDASTSPDADTSPDASTSPAA